MLPIIHLFIHLTGNQTKTTVRLASIRKKRLKVRINDSQVILTNGILDIKYTQPLSSQVQVQHTNANSNLEVQ